MVKDVNHYLSEGCYRCRFGGTAECKVHSWQAELHRLRELILSSGLTEEIKWSMPCYTFEGSNVLQLAAFKQYVAISFFKGVLIKDTHDFLIAPGANSQASRQLRFKNIEEITDKENVIGQYIAEAIQVEKAGKKVKFNKSPEPLPAELLKKMAEDLQFKTAFEALTPGRQRGYILYFSGAKQSGTRLTRIEKYIPKILEGKGFHDR